MEDDKKNNWFRHFPILLVSCLKAVEKIPSFRLKVKKEEWKFYWPYIQFWFIFFC